jgi:hypothetical protein
MQLSADSAITSTVITTSLKRTWLSYHKIIKIFQYINIAIVRKKRLNSLEWTSLHMPQNLPTAPSTKSIIDGKPRKNEGNKKKEIYQELHTTTEILSGMDEINKYLE